MRPVQHRNPDSQEIIAGLAFICQIKDTGELVDHAFKALEEHRAAAMRAGQEGEARDAEGVEIATESRDEAVWASNEHEDDALCATCGKSWGEHFGRCCDVEAGSEDRRFVLADRARDADSNGGTNG